MEFFVWSYVHENKKCYKDEQNKTGCALVNSSTNPSQNVTVSPLPAPTQPQKEYIVCDDEGVNNCTSPIVCDKACRVFCEGDSVCKGFNITCHAKEPCTVGCYGTSSCQDATITVASDQYAYVICGDPELYGNDNKNDDVNACKGAHVYIPPPQIPDSTALRFYDFQCLGRGACFDTTFEFVDYSMSQFYDGVVLDEWANIRCRVNESGGPFACDNTTRTVCPWQESKPDACFTRTELPFSPTVHPTSAPETKEDNTGKIVGGVIGGLCGVGLIAIIVVFYVKSRKEDERNYDPVSTDENNPLP